MRPSQLRSARQAPRERGVEVAKGSVRIQHLNGSEMKPKPLETARNRAETCENHLIFMDFTSFRAPNGLRGAQRLPNKGLQARPTASGCGPCAARLHTVLLRPLPSTQIHLLKVQNPSKRPEKLGKTRRNAAKRSDSEAGGRSSASKISTEPLRPQASRPLGRRSPTSCGHQA